DLAARKLSPAAHAREAIVSEELRGGREGLSVLEAGQVGGGTHLSPTATVRLRRADEMIEESAMGDGMIDAVMGAIGRAAGVEAKLVAFNVSSVTGGAGAFRGGVGQLGVAGPPGAGGGVATDVVEASGRAYLAAINRALQMRPDDEAGDEPGDEEGA